MLTMIKNETPYITESCGCTLRCGSGRLIEFRRPKIMGILNVTPDSFYSGSRVADSRDLARRCESMIESGAEILDIGAYSTRPGCAEISLDEEWNRLEPSLATAREVANGAAILSVDTFRSEIARRSVEEFGVGIINDISGGEDPSMFGEIARLGVGYVLMHIKGTTRDMMEHTDYEDVVAEVIGFLARRLAELRSLGVADVIIDPGFGFSQTIAGNYTLMRNLPEFRMLGCPILAGISRKSMLWKVLGITPEESLNATTALNMAALMGGAAILRVHDVKEAAETIEIFMNLKGSEFRDA